MKLISSKQFLKHKKEYHVERPERIKLVLQKYKFEPAKEGSVYLNSVHDSDYIEKVKHLSQEADKHIHYLDAGDTYVDNDTYKVACYAVGATVQAADSALKKQPAIAVVRPPGHHAHPRWTGGFCVFNNVAIGAAHMVSKGKRVLIIDIDLHRGDGTQDCVKHLNQQFNDNLYYLSFNQEGIFPGASLDEGNITNIYFSRETSEKEYIEKMLEHIHERIRLFKPTAIAVSAGFDIFKQDKKNYGTSLGCSLEMTKKVVFALKKAINDLPYFVVLEGGYDPESVLEGVDAFMSNRMTAQTKPRKKTKPKDKKTEKKRPATKKKTAVKKKVKIKKKTRKKTVKKKTKPKPKKKPAKKKTTSKTKKKLIKKKKK